jgi:hypothetical protein
MMRPEIARHYRQEGHIAGESISSSGVSRQLDADD